MTDGRCWRALGGLLVPVVVAGIAGCSGSGGSSPTTSSASASASAPASAGASGMFSAAQLRGALLTRVNGVAAATPASIGRYASLSAASLGRVAGSAVQAGTSGCAGATAAGLGSTILAAAPAAAVTFRVAGNAVSEVLVASSNGSASAVLAGHVPAECAKYLGKVAGKTVTYGVTDKAITGIGKQARELNVRANGAASDNQWSLIYRGAGFVGTVTVVGASASEAAVRELAQQAYAFAAKSLA
jgi:hypothetical protein